jgi:hypothetical protein
MSKAGIHIVLGPRNWYGDFVKAIAQAGKTLAIVKCVDDFGAADEAQRANLDTLTVGRVNEVAGRDMQAWEPQPNQTAQQAAGAYYALVKNKWVLNPFIDVWETFNEYSGNWSWQADFYIALMNLAEADGYRLGLWCTSGGNPPLPNMEVTNLRYISAVEARNMAMVSRTPRSMALGTDGIGEQPWEAIARVCRRAKQRNAGHVMCVHEYAWHGLLKDSWGNGVVGRYEALHEYLVSVDADIPIAITECGQNGGGGFVGVDQFMLDVETCDAKWMAAPYLAGVTMWTLGNWSNANFQAALPRLAQYIIEHPTPSAPPPPPPPDPRTYERVCHLVPPQVSTKPDEHGLFDARYMQILRLAGPGRESVLASADDAFITPPQCTARKVYVYDVGQWGGKDYFEAWVREWYPPVPEIIYRELV